MLKRGYSKKKKCLDCGKPISNQAKKCRSCAQKKPEQETKDHPLLAWRYDCPECGIVAHSFDRLPEIRDSAGHEVRRGARVICNSGKYHDYCPACGFSAGNHAGERKNEMLYEARCPASPV